MIRHVGRWALLWIALSLIFLVLALKHLRSELESNRLSAREVYGNEVSWKLTCDKLNAEKVTGFYEKRDDYVFANCSVDHSTRHATELRAQTQRDRNRDSVRHATEAFLSASVLSGVVFLGLGWTRTRCSERRRGVRGDHSSTGEAANGDGHWHNDR